MLVQEPDEAYHASAPVSKTTLWKLWSKTPFHARFEAQKTDNHLDLGKASHIAILEPDRFEQAVLRGPEDRRGNKWKEFMDRCEHFGAIGLTESDYDQVIAIRDMAHTVPELDIMRSGKTIIETSGYATLPVEDGYPLLDVKTRPDMFNVDAGIILDVKNMASASPASFQRDVGKFGYHVQHAMYWDVWEAASGFTVNAFMFLVIEKSNPPTFAVYELSPSAVAEGHAIYREALRRYAECLAADHWPGYPSGVTQIGLRKYDYHLTPAPEGEEVQAMGDEA